MSVNQLKMVAGIVIPDSKIASQATELLLEHGTEFIYNHSLRVFLFASLNGRRNAMAYDPELLYVSSLFHDLGLTSHYRSPDKRFEVDGANAARSFLEQHGIPHEATRLVLDAMALHNTRGIAQYMESVVALLYRGVVFDVIGDHFADFSEETRSQVVSA